jgi:hypothetical protein
MAGGDDDTPLGWYDEVMRGQLYDELIPAYAALQARMVADHAVSPVGLALVQGVMRLLRLLRWLAAACGLVAQW